jgi:hypothetical protein
MDASKLKSFADLLPALKAAGVDLVEIDYSGSGDSGQVDEVIVTNANEHVELPQLEEQLREATYDILGADWPGWEINEGSSGSIVWDLVIGDFKWTHDNIVESTETTEEHAVLK